ncbi:hypothetical protein DLAC_00558 [Tieghemostelium lacteum]|uniref:SAM dependent carboxyl methyltransferase n=1 Tax=Tieghemostelium lacteum TaxID=361077 RepID=A0A152AA17_TIELA|nr:hypothetical protein DLAC_00558 [Tieghemostelium lacteum]|eukprot:KYR03066.1 hypothetical protein DLAC_00558 [Tieghemostelium lacteum]
MNSTYNDNSKPQLNVFNKNQELIKNSIDLYIQNLLGNKERYGSIRILDVGSAQGRNSNSVLSLLIPKILSEVSDQNQFIEVFHNDLEVNNWTLLFMELKNNSNYKHLSDSIYTYGVGKSFYEQVVPSQSIHYSFMMNCAHWAKSTSNFNPPHDSMLVMDKNDIMLQEDRRSDLYSNLYHRSQELVTGGVLVANFLSFENENFGDFSRLMKLVFMDLVRDGVDTELTIEDIHNLYLPVYLFEQDDLLSTISRIPSFQLKSIQHNQTECTLQPLIKSHGVEFFAKCFSNFLISVAEATLKAAIKGDQQRKDKIFQEYLNRFTNHIKNNPTLYKSTISSYFVILEKI